MSAAWAWRSSRVDSRRSRSIARLRAVVMIQPAGAGGSPLSGHLRTATANASWTASSATSMSPNTRTRTATARPYSSRKARSTSVVIPAVERADLDRQRRRLRGLAAPLERRVEVGRADDRQPADVLLALGVRPVGHQHLVAADAHDGRGARRVQPAGEDPRAGGLHLVLQGGDVARDPVEVDRRRRVAVGLHDAEQVLLHRASGW